MQTLRISERQNERVSIEVARKSLEDVKKKDNAKIKQGYRWFKLTSLHQILIPYGNDGKPTEQGRNMVLAYMQSQNIKSLEYDTI